MPRGDTTGPMGMGPMTGRQAGYCTGFNMPGYFNNVGGRGPKAGLGRGANIGGRGKRSCGFGFRHRFFAAGVPGRSWFDSPATAFPQADPEMEKQALKSQAEYLQSEMDAIKKRLDELVAKDRNK